jgi:hypothetical protein
VVNLPQNLKISTKDEGGIITPAFAKPAYPTADITS